MEGREAVGWGGRSVPPGSIIQIQIQIILLSYNVLHGQTEFDHSYGNPQ